MVPDFVTLLKRLNNFNQFTLGLYGHSAVHHPKSTAIYVFGGMEYQMDKSVITNRLYALSLNLSVDPPTGRWNLLPPEHGRLTVDNLPIGKAFMRYQMFHIAHPFITLHDNFPSISSVISAPWRVAKTFQ